MKVKLVLWSLLLAITLPAAQAQVLIGDPQFSALHDVGWGMSMAEIRSLYEKNKKLIGITDSSLTLSTEFFGVSAPTEIQFHQGRRGPALIRIRFSEPSNSLADTISRHFTQFVRKAPTITTTEKKLFTISLRIEIAKWKTEKESVVLTTALRDGAIGDVGLMIYMAAE
jgi:hypothetical protein